MVNLDLGLYEVCGLLFDYMTFYALNNKRKFYLSDIIFFFITFPILFIFQDFGVPLSLIATIFEIFIFWLFYKKKFGSLQALTTILLTNFLSLVLDSILGEIISYKITSFPYFQSISYILAIIFLTWGIYHFNFSNFIKQVDNLPLFFLILFVFLSLLFIENFSKSIILVFISFQFIFIIFLFRYYQKKEFARQIQKEKDNLNIYLKTLKVEQEKLRSFKHDYQSLLSSLKYYADLNDMKSILKQLEIYSNNQISTNNLKISALNNISDPYLRSLVLEKFNTIYQLKIPYSFECNTKLKIPSSINIFDIIRMVGIGYDNAIEESKRLKSKNQDSQILVLFYQDSEHTEITIKNKISTLSDPTDFKKKGFTTKENHQGIGLSNILKIKNKYPQLRFQYFKKNDWFIFTLVF